jgi:RAB protein geranylgeranyltransferase component A
MAEQASWLKDSAGLHFVSLTEKERGNNCLADLVGRVCAVFGGVYMLGRPIGSIDMTPSVATQPSSSTQDYPQRVTIGSQTVRSKWLVASPSYLPRSRLSTTCAVARAVVVLSSPISLPAQEKAAFMTFDKETEGAGNSEPEDSVLVVFPPNSHGHGNPVHAVQMGAATFSCPEGQCKWCRL